jgi:Cof subfamily protein (haloacid dehalogenase superfamily)
MTANNPAMGRIVLVLADVDGTLVTEDKVLTDRARAAVHRLHAAGIKFAITSGRPPRGMAMLVEPLALTTPFAAFNGGVFVRSQDFSIIEERVLPRGAAERAVAIILAHDMDAWLYSGDAWLVRDTAAPHIAREEWTVKFPPTVVADFTDRLDRAVKIVGVSDDHERVQRCETDMRAALGDAASAARSQPYYLDVTHPEANKGAVVEYAARHLGISTQMIATIGDMPNDVLMFRKSGLSIAMGNASEEVRRQASFVTDSYNDEGFAKAIEHYILGSGGSEAGRTA